MFQFIPIECCRNYIFFSEVHHTLLISRYTWISAYGAVPPYNHQEGVHRLRCSPLTWFFSSLLSYWFWTSVYWAFGMMLNGLHGARISHCAPGNLYLNHLSYPVCSCSANLTIWFWWLIPTTVCLCLSSCLPLFWTMLFIFFIFLYVFCW